MSSLFIYGVMEWAIRLVMVAVILRRRFMPGTALAWLSVVFFLPIVGLVVYLLIGSNYLGRRRIRLYQQVLDRMRSQSRVTVRGHVLRPETDASAQPVVLQAERISGMPILGGNDVELLSEHERMIDRLVADIDAAVHHVHMLYYIFGTDETSHRVADALESAVARGVSCRVLADASGSRHFFGRRGLSERLRARGVTTQRMLPVHLLRRRLERLDLRNHRKLSVIDGRVAYAGSHNIVNADYGHRRAGPWIDLSARLRGPVVSQLQSVFLEDWLFETDQMLDEPGITPPPETAGTICAQAVPTGPSSDESESLLRVAVTAINAARRRIIISSPYLVPDEPTLLALSMASERDVEVDLVIPRRSDHPLVGFAGRAYFEPLLEAGVRIFLHEPGLLHAKTMTVDDSFALLGSSNFDIRSFYLNFELNVLLYGPQMTRELRFAQTQYISDAQPVDLAEWRQRPIARRYAQSAAALLSPLL
ncbi:MAG: cardiolipin synthase [Phycisphaeraceae bacterium]|nr:cardiolipin synthase [Phycisphaeraceae bacterium]